MTFTTVNHTDLPEFNINNMVFFSSVIVLSRCYCLLIIFHIYLISVMYS